MYIYILQTQYDKYDKIKLIETNDKMIVQCLLIVQGETNNDRQKSSDRFFPPVESLNACLNYNLNVIQHINTTKIKSLENIIIDRLHLYHRILY